MKSILKIALVAFLAIGMVTSASATDHKKKVKKGHTTKVCPPTCPKTKSCH